jgi:hypothetical protein
MTMAACGGPDETADLGASANANANDAALKGRGGTGGGGVVSSGVSISATNATYGGYTIVSFYPGSYANSQLYVGYQCTQNGVSVLAASSWELHYAVSAGYVSYALIGDHYNVVFQGLDSQQYTGGSASCVVQGYTRGSKGGLSAVASNTFTITG